MIGDSGPPDQPTLPPTESADLDLRLGVCAPGDRVAGRYRIEGQLGSGSSGVVYRAHDETLGRAVALKMLTPKHAASADEKRVATFLKEARTLARLEHPHIVSVYDAGVEQGVPWLVIRLVAGRSLAEAVHEEGPMPLERALRRLEPIARALQYAHDQGVIHRDVKPANILLETRDGGSEHVWLTDFGVAKVVGGEGTWKERVIIGTPCYMAPEQVAGKRIGPGVDMFALGCVAIELVTGRRAFEGDSLSDVAYRIVHKNPENWDEFEHLGGPQLAQVVRRALAKSPQDRHPAARDLADDLATLLRPDAKMGRLALRTLLHRDSQEDWDGRSAVWARGVSKSYVFRKKVLNGLDIDVESGATYALLGRNGEGKTTLIRILLGLYRADRGQVRVFGRPPRRRHAAILARVGYVSENLNAYEAMRVSDFLQFVRRFYDTSWDAVYAYHLLGRYELPLDARIRELSKGMRTKVSLVAALAHRPDLLLLDDPTIGLDAVVLTEFFETLREASRREGTTVFLASHNIDEVEAFATHVGFLARGRLDVSEPLETLRRRVRGVKLTFSGSVPDVSRLGELHHARTVGQELSGVVFDARPDVLARLRGLGPQDMALRELTLKEIFVAHCG